MSEIENEIVSITFDNESFERRLAETLASLDKLSESLRFAGASDGLAQVSAAANDLNLSHIEEAVDTISSKFSAMGAIAFSVIQNLTTSAIDFAKTTADKIIGPILSGGQTRATNIENAKFQFRGLGIDVEKAMSSALAAVKGTAFGLDEAAKAAAQFGASGIDAGSDMTQALRGIAGAAAMTNTSFAEIADIFTSAAGTGFVNNQDLQRFATRGLNATATLAKAFHTTEAGVREMARNGDISFAKFSKAMDDAFGEHATKANETYTGALANLHAAMSRLGATFFGPELEQQRDLFNAMSPAIDNFSGALQPLMSTFTNLRRLGVDTLIRTIQGLDFTNLKNAAPNFGQALTNAFIGLHQIIVTIKDAFRDIFPPSSTSLIIKISEAVLRFSEHLKMGDKTLALLTSAFHGFFAVISIGIEIVKGIFNTFRELFTTLADASGIEGSPILLFFARLGESLTDLKKRLVDGKGIADFFSHLTEVIKDPIRILEHLKEAIRSLFGGGEIPGVQGVEASFGRIGQRMGMLQSLVKTVSDAWHHLTDVLSGVIDVLDAIWDYIGNWFAELGHKLAAVMQPGDFNAAVDLVNAGLLGGIALAIRKFMKDGFPLDFSRGVLDTIKEAFGGLTDTLKAMQLQLKAKALISLAIAVGLLTASMVVLSLIDSAALTKALVAMSVGFGQLIGAMTLMDKAGVKPRTFLQLATGMILLSTAISILSLSVLVLSKLSPDELSRGLTGVAVSIGVMVGATRLISSDAKGLITAAFAMNGMATALLLLSGVVKIFGSMDAGSLAKGLGAMAISLAVLVGATLLISTNPEGLIAGTAAILGMAGALLIISGVVKIFSTMNIGELAKGIGAMAVSLGVLVGATLLMSTNPAGLIAGSAAMVLMANALVVMSGAVLILGQADMDTLAKGIGSIAAMLLILSAGLIVMQGTLGGSAALVVASGALMLLTKVLVVLGDLSIAQLVTGLGAIAAVFAVLGISALLLEPVIPALFGLGVALALIGGGFALFGLGASLVAKAFETLATSAKSGIGALIDAFKLLLTAMPEIEGAMVLAIMSIAQELLDAAPLLVKSISVLIGHILDTLIELAPKFGEAAVVIIATLLDAMEESFPKLVKTGLSMLLALLRGIRDNISEIVEVVADITINFIEALTKKAPEFTDALFDFFMSVITSVAFEIGEQSTAFIAVGQALIDGFLTGLTENLANLLQFFINLPGKIVGIIKEALGINSPSTVFKSLGGDLITGFLNGLVETVGGVMTWFIELPGKILGWIGELITTLAPKGIDLIVGLLSGIVEKAADVISWFTGLPGKVLWWIGDVTGKLYDVGKDFIKGLIDGIIKKASLVFDYFYLLPGKIIGIIPNPLGTLFNIGKDLLQGLWEGLKDKWNGLKGWFGDRVNDVKSFFTGGFLTGSPSRWFKELGGHLFEGLGIGLASEWKNVSQWLNTTVKTIKNVSTSTVNSAISAIASKIGDISEFNPTISPILDLSQVKAAAKGIDGLLSVSTISPVVSLDNALLISRATVAAQDDSASIAPQRTGDIKFEQNIYAPEALSINDIYRSTKSQIALAKEELKIS